MESGSVAIVAEPFLYFGWLIIAGRLLRLPAASRPGLLRLGLLALARALLGTVAGFLTFGATTSLTTSDAAWVSAVGAVGFLLWLATSRLAFPVARPSQLLAVSAVGELLSLAVMTLFLRDLFRHIH